MFDFGDYPGMMYVVGTLVPLASFVALLTLGGLKNLGRRYQDTGWGQSLYWLLGAEQPGRVGAYVATVAIGISAVLGTIGLVRFLGEHPLGHHEHEQHAAVETHKDHEHADAKGDKHEHYNEHDATDHADAAWAGRVMFASMARLRDDHRPGMKLELGYRIDHFGAAMFAMVAFVATLIHIFALGYMSDETQKMVDDHQAHFTRRGRYERFFMWFSLFCFSMLNLVIADNFFQVFVSWELVGACSFGLIGFYYERHTASTAANKAFITNRVGDVGFIVGLMILWSSVGTLNFEEVFARVRCPSADSDGSLPLAGQIVRLDTAEVKNGEQIYKWTPDGEGQAVALFPLHAKHWHGLGAADPKRNHPLDQEISVAPKTELDDYSAMPYWLLTVAGLGIFLGCVGKSAQFPLQVWLPDAMEGPTPVSALVHSATMVAAGVYLTGRAFPLFTPECRLAIAYTGAITVVVAATIAMVVHDIKRVLAYSTVSQLGYMILALGVGGWVAGLLHLLTHAFFKALLFLCSGSVIYGCHHEQDMRKMGGLGKKMPITAATMLVGCLAIAGTPLFSGWYSKDAILAECLAFMTNSPGHFLLLLAPLVTAGITCFYMFRMWFLTFTGKPKDEHVFEHAHESPKTMTVPLIILACFSVFVAWGWPLWDAEASYLGHIIGASEPMGAHAEAHAMHEAAHHVLPVHSVAGALALMAAVIGVVFAVVTYLTKALDPAEAVAQFPRFHRLLENKWYFDELYSAMVCRPALAVAGWCKKFDANAIDSFIDGAANWVIGLSRFGGKVDNRVVDGMVNVTGNAVRGFGRSLRHVQTGHLRGYVLYLVLGAVALFALATYFVSLAAAR
jgi:NADH-quinone oxidoreductase subunit L